MPIIIIFVYKKIPAGFRHLLSRLSYLRDL
jgi:hypothetical protein